MILGAVGAALVTVAAVVLGRRGAVAVVRYHSWAWAQRKVEPPEPDWSGVPEPGETLARVISGIGAVAVIAGAFYFGR